MAGHGGVGAGAAEAGEADDDQFGVVSLEEGGRVQVQGFEHVGTEGVDEDVGVGEEGEEEGVRRGGFEV